MTLPNPVTFSGQLAAEYGVPVTSPCPNAYYGKPGLPSSGPASTVDFGGKSNIAFTPDGGPVSAFTAGSATASVVCNQPAVWTYNGGGSGASVDVPSGGTSSAISFTVVAPGVPDVTRAWTLNGLCNGVSRDFAVSVTAYGSGGGS